MISQKRDSFTNSKIISFFSNGEILCADTFSTAQRCPKKFVVLETPQFARFPCACSDELFEFDSFILSKTKGYHTVSLCFWRRRRDSNSRTSFPAYSLSRGAPSTYLGTSPYVMKLTSAVLQIRHKNGDVCRRRKLAEKVGFEPTALSSHWFSRPAP